jgi:hypothetical protein
MVNQEKMATLLESVPKALRLQTPFSHEYVQQLLIGDLIKLSLL